MIISELYLRNVTVPAPDSIAGDRSVTVTDPQIYLDSLGLGELKADLTLSALSAILQPGARLPIHKDLTNTTDQVEWSVILGGAGLIIEIYTEGPSYIHSSSIGAPAGTHPVPVLNSEDAILIESITLGNSPIIFNPYAHWHSAYNPTDNIIQCISLRSRTVHAAQFLEKFKKK